MKHQTRLITVLIVALVMTVLAIAPSVFGQGTGPGGPPMPNIAQSTSYVLLPARAITNGVTIYNTANVSLGQWPLADVFVTADVSGTAYITVTPQYSADNINWVDASYTYLANNCTTGATITSAPTLAGTTSVTATADITTSLTSVTGGSVITTTGPITATTTSVCATSEAAGNYQMLLSSDTTVVERVPIVGDYFRVKIANTGTVTVTVKATVKDGVR